METILQCDVGSTTTATQSRRLLWGRAFVSGRQARSGVQRRKVARINASCVIRCSSGTQQTLQEWWSSSFCSGWWHGMARFALVRLAVVVFLFTQDFDVSLMNDSHLHMSDDECEHCTLVMNAQHSKFTVRVFMVAQGHQRVDHENLGCIVDNYRAMFESRISAGATEKLPCSEKSAYFFVVL